MKVDFGRFMKGMNGITDANFLNIRTSSCKFPCYKTISKQNKNVHSITRKVFGFFVQYLSKFEYP